LRRLAYNSVAWEVLERQKGCLIFGPTGSGPCRKPARNDHGMDSRGLDSMWWTPGGLDSGWPQYRNFIDTLADDTLADDTLADYLLV